MSIQLIQQAICYMEEHIYENISYTDVAKSVHMYGYESPESFSKAFSRFHGSSPKQAKRKGTKLRLFNPLVIKISF